MIKKAFFLLGLILFFKLPLAFAFFGQTETKRERRLREELHSQASSVSYEAVQESFLREDYSGTEKLSRKYLSGRDKSHFYEALSLEALSLLKLGRFSEARNELHEIERSSQTEDLRSQAAVSIGDSYYLQNDVSSAYQSYQAALKKFPETGEAPYVQSRLAELSKKLGRTIAASKPVSLRQAFVEESPFYSVQVGSFSKERNARVLIQKLARQKYEAYLDGHSLAGLFRVRVGKLAVREAAESLESRLKKDGYVTQIYP